MKDKSDKQGELLTDGDDDGAEGDGGSGGGGGNAL